MGAFAHRGVGFACVPFQPLAYLHLTALALLPKLFPGHRAKRPQPGSVTMYLDRKIHRVRLA